MNNSETRPAEIEYVSPVPGYPGGSGWRNRTTEPTFLSKINDIRDAFRGIRAKSAFQSLGSYCVGFCSFTPDTPEPLFSSPDLEEEKNKKINSERRGRSGSGVVPGGTENEDFARNHPGTLLALGAGFARHNRRARGQRRNEE